MRRDTRTNLDALTPAEGEWRIDLTDFTARIGDGSTVGGVKRFPSYSGLAVRGDLLLVNSSSIWVRKAAGAAGTVFVGGTDPDYSASPSLTGLTLSGLTASTALVTDGSKALTSSAVTATELGYVSGVTSALQTQLGNKQALNANLTTIAGITPARGDILVADSTPAWTRKATGASGTVWIGGTDPSYSASPTLTSIVGSGGQALVLSTANTSEFYNSTTAQIVRIFNTRTDASNGEWASLDWTTTANTFTIAAVKNGTGTQRGINFATSATVLSLPATASGVSIITGLLKSNNYETSNVAGYIAWNGRSNIDTSADGVIRISNYAQTDFNRLQFGGTTSSFPALKRSSAILQGRLADDSDYCFIQAKWKSSDGTSGVSAGPFTAITAITVKDGLITSITGT